MGYCIDGEDRFDVFLSYARVDDEAHNRFVSDFERYLTDKVRAELHRDPEADRDRSGLFSVCRDETGFPTSGSLSQVIEDYISHSRFLFIFLGSGYLSSQWCLSELDLFRQSTGGTLTEALERLFLIVLDREALVALREGREPPDLSPERKRFWTQLQGVAKNTIRREDFLQRDELLPIYQDSNRVYPDFHKAGMRVVKDLVKKLNACRQSTQPQPPMRSAKVGFKIVIGAVPPRLVAVRAELMAALGEAQVCAVQEDDLKYPARMRQHMERASIFVQPFDRAAPIVGSRSAPPGGHLAIQQKVFEEALAGGHTDSNAPIIWWEPPIPRTEDAQAAEDTDRQFLDEIDRLPPSLRRQCSPKALGEKLLARGHGPSSYARVWIEWQESDGWTIDAAKRKVQEHFQAYCDKRAAQGVKIDVALKFGIADWETLEEIRAKDSKKPDGVVIVYNQHKDSDAFLEQSDRISNLEDVLQKKMFPGIFYMRSRGLLLPTDDWGFVRFTRTSHTIEYKQEELDDFVERLFEVLHRKYPLKTLGGRP
jgi:hypothetical protein